MANQTTPERTGQKQSKRRRNWSITGALGAAASIVTILTFINSNNSTSSQSGNVSPPTTSAPTTSAATSSAPTATNGQGGIPSLDLGTWGGFLQGSGISERVIINLFQGKDASDVGSFSNQTFNCQGAIFLNGDTTVTMNGTSAPAIDLNLETTQNPAGACVSSAEAVAASSDGNTLVFEIVTAGSAQGTIQNPLAGGNLTH
jgi:hypothetical protein